MPSSKAAGVASQTLLLNSGSKSQAERDDASAFSSTPAEAVPAAPITPQSPADRDHFRSDDANDVEDNDDDSSEALVPGVILQLRATFGVLAPALESHAYHSGCIAKGEEEMYEYFLTHLKEIMLSIERKVDRQSYLSLFRSNLIYILQQEYGEQAELIVDQMMCTTDDATLFKSLIHLGTLEELVMHATTMLYNPIYSGSAYGGGRAGRGYAQRSGGGSYDYSGAYRSAHDYVAEPRGGRATREYRDPIMGTSRGSDGLGASDVSVGGEGHYARKYNGGGVGGGSQRGIHSLHQSSGTPPGAAAAYGSSQSHYDRVGQQPGGPVLQRSGSDSRGAPPLAPAPSQRPPHPASALSTQPYESSTALQYRERSQSGPYGQQPPSHDGSRQGSQPQQPPPVAAPSPSPSTGLAMPQHRHNIVHRHHIAQGSWPLKVQPTTPPAPADGPPTAAPAPRTSHNIPAPLSVQQQQQQQAGSATSAVPAVTATRPAGTGAVRPPFIHHSLHHSAPAVAAMPERMPTIAPVDSQTASNGTPRTPATNGYSPVTPLERLQPAHHHHHHHHHLHLRQPISPPQPPQPSQPQQAAAAAAAAPLGTPTQRTGLKIPMHHHHHHLMRRPAATAAAVPLPAQQPPTCIDGDDRLQSPSIRYPHQQQMRAPMWQRERDELYAALISSGVDAESAMMATDLGKPLQELSDCPTHILDGMLSHCGIRDPSTRHRVRDALLHLSQPPPSSRQRASGEAGLDLQQFMQKNSISNSGLESSGEGAAVPASTRRQQPPVQPSPSAAAPRPAMQVPQPRTKSLQLQSSGAATNTDSSIASPTESGYVPAEADNGRQDGRGVSPRGTPAGPYRDRTGEEDDGKEEEPVRRGTKRGGRGGYGHHRGRGRFGRDGEDPQVCRFFSTPDGCHNGKSCRFRHIQR